MNTIIVIGGGASGIIAALEAAKSKDNKVILLERHNRIGRKLSATGNGRCNLTNTNASIEHYHGSDPSFVEFALNTFSSNDTIAYFNKLGLLTSVQYGGRVYPLSDSANSVLDVLRFALEASSVDVQTSCEVQSISYNDNNFFVSSNLGNFKSDYLIIACGGKAGGKLGGCSDGYNFLTSLGHHCSKIYPALVPITTNNELVRSLKGVRCEAKLSLNNQSAQGEIQFTDNGISGPAAFDISREATTNGGTIYIDFLVGNITNILFDRIEYLPYIECSNFLNGIVHSRIGIAIIKSCGIKPSMHLSELTEQDVKRISNACSSFMLKVKGTGSFDNAQITVGGIYTSEFDDKTMESKLVKGLYACGEVLDIDGDCGGYNLQWAWSSGFIAGRLGK